MRLEEIGFYTLHDDRAKNASADSPLQRCELILTSRCNFHCTYCRPMREECRGQMPLPQAKEVLDHWIADGLRNVRFSGGEPMLYPNLEFLVSHCAQKGVQHIAISSNGSASIELYDKMLCSGVNDFSISLDSCCAQEAEMMSGGVKAFDRVVETIRFLSSRTYVTVGVVLTDKNYDNLVSTVQFASSLGVADIRIISAAQENFAMEAAKDIPQPLLDKHPILRYRVNNILKGRGVRGIQKQDCKRCYLSLDDMVVAGSSHFPCVIYFRERGEPIGPVGPNMRVERGEWFRKHDTVEDPICSKNCLDVCVDYNNKALYYDVSGMVRE